MIAALTLMSNTDKVAQSVLGEPLHGFFVLTAWDLAVPLVVLVIAVLSRPYRWAVAIRSWVKRTDAASRRQAAVTAGARWLPRWLLMRLAFSWQAPMSRLWVAW